MAKRKRSRATSQSRSIDIGLNTGFIIAMVVIAVIVAAGGFFLLSGNSEAELQVEEPAATGPTDGQVVASLPVAPEVGALAPNFVLSDITGEQVSLSDFQGQPVVVTFFHTW